jgi:hypothetical protein
MCSPQELLLSGRGLLIGESGTVGGGGRGGQEEFDGRIAEAEERQELLEEAAQMQLRIRRLAGVQQLMAGGPKSPGSGGNGSASGGGGGRAQPRPCKEWVHFE